MGAHRNLRPIRHHIIREAAGSPIGDAATPLPVRSEGKTIRQDVVSLRGAADQVADIIPPASV
jgi:hypothetical protein